MSECRKFNANALHATVELVVPRNVDSLAPAVENGSMEPDNAQEQSERDQLWASLRQLRGEIEAMAATDFVARSERELQMVQVLARVVAAELDFRERETGPPS